MKGTGGAGGGKRIQIARARVKQWTPRLEDRFIDMLAATCNVKLACAEVGMTAPSAYYHRHRWPAFARRWDQAVLAGYERIEQGLTADVIAALQPPAYPDEWREPVVAPVSVDDAIRVMGLHERKAREERARQRRGEV